MPKKYNSASPLSEAEEALQYWGIAYVKSPDGTLTVTGDLSLENKNLTSLPDLSAVVVKGSFYCSYNKITSLKGAPQNVGYHFDCSYNKLVTLEGAPSSVFGNFVCENCSLDTLEGAPHTIHGSFYCNDNDLLTLKGAPRTVGETFDCACNRLHTLEGAPESVGGTFRCDVNFLEYLECAPRASRGIVSSHGSFTTWDDVPERLKTSPETKERLEKEAQEEKERRINAATVLEKPITVAIPLRLKSRRLP